MVAAAGCDLSRNVVIRESRARRPVHLRTAQSSLHVIFLLSCSVMAVDDPQQRCEVAPNNRSKHFVGTTNLLIITLLCSALAFAQSGGAFKVRGALPWHNFLSGPTAWNEADWDQYLDWMQRSGLNLLALHNYTGGARRYMNYVEPMIRIEYRNVVPEAFFDTSLTARWGYRPLAVKDFPFGTAKLFGNVPAYGSDAALLARDNEDRYRRAQSLIRHVIEGAHKRRIQVAMGFEFGVYPPELFSIIPQDSYISTSLLPDPTHPASQEILRITIDNMLQVYPGIDQIWLWLQEHEAPAGTTRLSPALRNLISKESNVFAGASPDIAFTGVYALEYIRSAHAYLKQRAPKVKVAIGGWGGATQLTGILGGLNKALPRDIAFTCLNPAQGLQPQPAIFEEIAKTREAWVIPWLEGDAKLWHPQPRVETLRSQIELARKQGVQGVIAIHWRTEDIRQNMEAFARFSAAPAPGSATADFYRDLAAAHYGNAALAALLIQMDRERWFERMQSPDYFPYDPRVWGRIDPELRAKIAAAADQLEAAEGNRENIGFLASHLRFTLLFDEVSKALAPAYRLNEKSVSSVRITADEITAARRALASAPVEGMIRTYAGRVRSRGELGVLSSINQRVWLQYLELEKFLKDLTRKNAEARMPNAVSSRARQ